MAKREMTLPGEYQGIAGHNWQIVEGEGHVKADDGA